MKISLAVALLLTTSVSATKLPDNSLCEVQNLQETSKELAEVERGRRGRDPGLVVTTLSNTAIDELKGIAPMIQHERRSIEGALNGLNHGEQQLAGMAGVKVSDADQYDPKFMSELLVAEYAGAVSFLDSHRGEAAQQLKGALRYTPLRYYLAQTNQPGPAQLPHGWCKEESKNEATCQVVDNLPNPSIILNQWVRGIDDANKQFSDSAQKYIARDIGAFNEMLTHEAKRLGVALPKSLPDPDKLAARLRAYVALADKLTHGHVDMLLNYIKQVEMSIGYTVSGVYGDVAREANRNNRGSGLPEVPRNKIPLDNPVELMALGSGALKALKDVNYSRDARRLYRDLAPMIIASGDTEVVEQLLQQSANGALNEAISGVEEQARRMMNRKH